MVADRRAVHRSVGRRCHHASVNLARPTGLVALMCLALGACSSGTATNRSSGARSPSRSSSARNAATAAPTTKAATTTVPTTAAPPTVPSSAKTLRLATTVTGHISPKSVVASGAGLVFAQNMMYTHTITVYDRDGKLLQTIPDTVRLSDLGFPLLPNTLKGAPVEAAFTPDHRFAYVSNYSMYGPGFTHPGDDTCSPSSGIDQSFVYRVDTTSFAIDKAIAVGSVPKYVAVTPDGRHALVSNWCSYDLSVIDTASSTETARVKLGAYPRGIVVDPASTTAYVAVMGSFDIAKVSLADSTVSWIRRVGNAPRHLALDPSGAFLYATLNGEGRVAKIDVATGAVVAKVATGSAPRSMAIAPDGQSLYVVNYNSGTVTKVATSDLRVLQTVRTPTHPIGITYEPAAGRVWVACYSGAILVYDDA